MTEGGRIAEGNTAPLADTPPGNQTQSVAAVVCSLAVHDEHTSQEDILLNLRLFPGANVRPGDLVELAALNTSEASHEPARAPAVPKRTGNEDNVHAEGDALHESRRLVEIRRATLRNYRARSVELTCAKVKGRRRPEMLHIRGQGS